MIQKKKLTRAISAAIVLAVLVSTVSCTSIVGSSREIWAFKTDVRGDEASKSDYIRISGTLSDSALWIKEYTVTYDNTDMHVTIARSLKTTGNNGPYFIEVLLPKTVNTVYLGNEIVWRRTLQ
ncbi:MAG TPA: hypothetical protein PKK43_00680 [Spirochaetota bacterium]|nr:hypothetical protein [Spirochaetota bacterium]